MRAKRGRINASDTGDCEEYGNVEFGEHVVECVVYRSITIIKLLSGKLKILSRMVPLRLRGTGTHQ